MNNSGKYSWNSLFCSCQLEDVVDFEPLFWSEERNTNESLIPCVCFFPRPQYFCHVILITQLQSPEFPLVVTVVVVINIGLSDIEVGGVPHHIAHWMRSQHILDKFKLCTQRLPLEDASAHVFQTLHSALSCTDRPCAATKLPCCIFCPPIVWYLTLC